MSKPDTDEKWITDIVGTFTDPIIAYPSPWKDDIPDWLKSRITLERLIMNMSTHAGEEPTGTDAEALAYLFPASLEAPLGSDWTEVYLYLATRVCTAEGKEVPKDIQVETLSDYRMNELNRLKSFIYDQRIKARLEKNRGERREKKEEEAVEKKEAQPSLFDASLYG